jgi:hypothetical protein
VRWHKENTYCWLELDSCSCNQTEAHAFIECWDDDSDEPYEIDIIFHCRDQPIRSSYNFEYATLEEAKADAEKILGLT